MTEEDIETKKIRHLERIINNLGQYWNSIEILLGFVSKPLLVDDRGLASATARMTEKLREIVESIEHLDLSQTFAEIKYIGKRLLAIEKSISEIKEEGIKKKIHVDVSCEGYEMVKKRPVCINTEQEFDPDAALNELLNTLTEREKQCVIYRLGLFGEKKNTYDKIGEIFKVGRERASQIYIKSIRKLRHSSRRSLAEKITHLELRKEIFVE